MLLGKRPRPPMRRTTSLSEIIFDVGGGGGGDVHQTAENSAAGRNQKPPQSPCYWPHQSREQDQKPSNGLDTRLTAAMAAPRNPRRNSGDFAVDQASFLRTCGLCKRRLGPGKDTFMYRGELAFCSLDCRQKHIILEERRERKERCSIAAMKKDAAEVPPGAAGTAEAAADSETIVAA